MLTIHTFYVLLLACFGCLSAALSDKGVLYLDDFTFDKVVDKDRDVLVKFDKEYPWGDAHDAYKKLAETVGLADTPLVVAGVPISNSETYPVNPKLAARFGLLGLKDDSFPRIKLFKRGADTAKPVDYSGAMKDSSELLRWTVEQTGVFVGVKGQVKELDALAQQFVAAPGKSRKDLFAQAKAAADAVDTSASPDTSSYVEYYIKTMQRVLDKGDSYLEQESKRLKKMAEDKAVAATKRGTFEWRLNVLSSFTRKAGEQQQMEKQTEL